MHAGNAFGRADFAAWRPEAAGDGHSMHWNIAQLGMRRLRKIFDALIFPAWRIDQRNRSSRNCLFIGNIASKSSMNGQSRYGSHRDRRRHKLSARDVSLFSHILVPLIYRDVQFIETIE